MKNQHNERNTARRSGFTLVEVLLVVAILGILAGVLVMNLGGRQKVAMVNSARASIATITTAIDIYEQDTGRYPPSLQSLINNDGAPNWRGPYIRGQSLQDPWGTDFGYAQQGDTGYKITSAGPDKSMGSADDITSQ